MRGRGVMRAEKGGCFWGQKEGSGDMQLTKGGGSLPRARRKKKREERLTSPKRGGLKITRVRSLERSRAEMLNRYSEGREAKIGRQRYNS